MYNQLPEEILNHETVAGKSSNSEIEFIQSIIPGTDGAAIEQDMKMKVDLYRVRRKKAKQTPKLKKTILSNTERKRLGLYKISKKELEYEKFAILHSLWKDYMENILNINHITSKTFQDKYLENISKLLLKADYHGALMTVIRSRCSSLVGISGIVVFDTKNTFRLICRDNILRTVPKKHSVFKFTLNGYTFTIFGQHFCIRPSERSAKKIKNFMVADM